jgi:hypothetical protein
MKHILPILLIACFATAHLLQPLSNLSISDWSKTLPNHERVFYLTTNQRIQQTEGTKTTTITSPPIPSLNVLKIVPISTIEVALLYVNLLFLYNSKANTTRSFNLYSDQDHQSVDACYTSGYVLIATKFNTEFQMWSLNINDGTFVNINAGTMQKQPLLLSNAKYAYFTVQNIVKIFNADTQIVQTVYDYGDNIINLFTPVANYLYISVKVSGNEELYRMSFTDQKIQKVFTTTSESIMDIIGAPESTSQSQILIRTNQNIYFCIFESSGCGTPVSVQGQGIMTMTGTWATNTFIYKSASNDLYALNSTNKAPILLKSNIQMPNRISTTSMITFTNFKYNSILKLIFMVALELEQNKALRAELMAFNVDDKILLDIVPLCVSKEGTCDLNSYLYYHLRDGSLLVETRHDNVNLATKFIYGSEPVPTPTSKPLIDEDLTWAFIVGGVIAGVLVIGVLFMIGIAVRRIYLRNKGYENI